MASSSLLRSSFLVLLLLLMLSSSTRGARVDETAVLTLDVGNFSEVVAAHQFIVVNFYAPWCYWSNKLAPQYEKAASILRNHDPPIVLAKIDAIDEKNKDCIRKYRIQGYPTVKILMNAGNTEQDYFGERDAASIVQYLKKQVGPASTEIKPAEDAESSITDGNDKGNVIDGTLGLYYKPDQIPEVSDEPVKKVAANNLNDVISNSAMKVLLELRERMKWACQILVATITEIFTKHE